MTTKVNLVAEIRNGKPFLENLLVEQLGTNCYRLVHSPGLVPGLAAGDEFELAESELHGYRLLNHGGNVSVQILFSHGTNECRKTLVPMVEQIGGWLDGETSGSSSGLLVFTFPVRTGFPTIENVMATAKIISPDCECYYGNVYDLNDGVTPLNWWIQT